VTNPIGISGASHAARGIGQLKWFSVPVSDGVTDPQWESNHGGLRRSMLQAKYYPEEDLQRAVN